MLWIVYALSGAFFKSLTGVFRKKISARMHAMVFAWLNAAIATLLLLPLLFFLPHDVFGVFQHHFVLVLGAGVFSLVGVILNVKALDKEELSFVAPLNDFIPLFTLLYAWLFLAELPPLTGIAGLLVIIIGTYVMAIKPNRMRWYDPFIHLAKSSAAWLSLGVAASYAINTVFLKAATDAGYDTFTVLYATNLLSCGLASYILLTKRRREIIPSLRRSGLAVIGSSVSSLLGAFLHIAAVSLTYASYAVSLRRFDTVFSVLLGWKLLKESNIRNKLIGAVIITAGTILLAFT